MYLGLQGDEWRQEREQRRAVLTTLRNFRAEVARNRRVVAGVRGYHAALADMLAAVRRRGGRTLDDVFAAFRYAGKPFQGFRPADFERTA